MENKNRLLSILKYMWEKTDEDHTTDIAELTRYLEQNGITVTRKTLTADIKELQDFGIDIICNRCEKNRYFIGNRGMDFAEVKLLVDTLEASHFLSRNKTNQIENALTMFVSEAQRKELRHPLYSNGTRKSKNEQVLLNVDRLFAAIRAKHQVRFRLRRYTRYKEVGFANNGEYYTFSPYELVYNDGNYYVIGFSEKHQSLGQFRVDRMMELKETYQKARPRPPKEELDAHIAGAFSMFSGQRVRVSLLCTDDMMDYVVERFGEDVDTTPLEGGRFRAMVDVEKSPMFYSWIVGFGGKIRIEGPEEVKEDFYKLLAEF
ncbi:MAG: WYL domain-containing protein [Lachnospiraceae bacterium]|nr:WYL domain-containing protein [Lachnospiraceae bacterium]